MSNLDSFAIKFGDSEMRCKCQEIPRNVTFGETLTILLIGPLFCSFGSLEYCYFTEMPLLVL